MTTPYDVTTTLRDHVRNLPINGEPWIIPRRKVSSVRVTACNLKMGIQLQITRDGDMARVVRVA